MLQGRRKLRFSLIPIDACVSLWLPVQVRKRRLGPWVMQPYGGRGGLQCQLHNFANLSCWGSDFCLVYTLHCWLLWLQVQPPKVSMTECLTWRQSVWFRRASHGLWAGPDGPDATANAIPPAGQNIQLQPSNGRVKSLASHLGVWAFVHERCVSLTAAISPKEINQCLGVPDSASFQGLGSKFRFFTLSLVKVWGENCCFALVNVAKIVAKQNRSRGDFMSLPLRVLSICGIVTVFVLQAGTTSKFKQFHALTHTGT